MNKSLYLGKLLCCSFHSFLDLDANLTFLWCWDAISGGVCVCVMHNYNENTDAFSSYNTIRGSHIILANSIKHHQSEILLRALWSYIIWHDSYLVWLLLQFLESILPSTRGFLLFYFVSSSLWVYCRISSGGICQLHFCTLVKYIVFEREFHHENLLKN